MKQSSLSRLAAMHFAKLSSAFVLLASVATAQDLPNPVQPSDFPTVSADSVNLGRNLFFDPILSGNRNISCATCHHPSMGTSDDMSLSMGEGGEGLGQERRIVTTNAPKHRIPRNAPALFNIGASEFTVMFHDGRVQLDPDAPGGVRMPAGNELERPLPSALAGQTILPVLSGDEMAGQPGENDIADLTDAGKISGPDGAWAALAARVESIPEYRDSFIGLNGDQPLHITDIAKVLADFITFEFRATNSPFDQYLNGKDVLTEAQKRGMELFYSKAECATCHSGAFMTDHQFHALGLPQFGPGKNVPGTPYADHGRGAVSGDMADTYRFRTPSLRNISLTAPYGHNGAYTTLQAMVRHHLDPIRSLVNYDVTEARLHEGDLGENAFAAMNDTVELLNIAKAIEIVPVQLSGDELSDLMAFLGALTDPGSQNGRLGVPNAVPSGLAMDVTATD